MGWWRRREWRGVCVYMVYVLIYTAVNRLDFFTDLHMFCELSNSTLKLPPTNLGRQESLKRI